MVLPGARERGSPRSIAAGLDRVFRQLVLLVMLLALTMGALFAYLIGVVRPDFSRYREANRALQQAHAGMLDQETGLRGYLLLEDARYLEPYREGAAAVKHNDKTLTRTLGRDSDLAPMLLAMRLAQQAWQSEWASRVSVESLPADREALADSGNRGKQLFDRYRTAELALQDHLEARRDALYAREGVSLAVGLVMTLVLGALLVAVVVRHRRQLHRVVEDPVVDILGVTEAIANHDLRTHLVPSGPTELRRIGESVNAMRDSLVEARDQQRAAQDRIELQAGQLKSILAMSREIAGSLNLRYVLRTVAAAATGVSGFARVIIWLADDPAGSTLAARYDSQGIDGVPVEELLVELGIGAVGQAVRYGRTATANEHGEPSVELHPEKGIPTLAVPLVVGARVSGAIELSSPEPHLLTEGTLDVLETLASHAAAAIEAARLHSSTEELAHTDALTGLLNRRRLDADLAMECERSARYHRPFGLIMFDVDHFKRLNDTHGHTRGDEVLQQLAAAVAAEVRTTDTIYRYGGEEFAVLARETRLDDAVELAERLRSRIEELFAARGSVGQVTASFGIALVPPTAPVPTDVITSADRALYRAKSEGRNRVCGPGES